MKVNRRTQILFSAFLCAVVLLFGVTKLRAAGMVDAEVLVMNGTYNVEAEFVSADEELGVEADLEHWYKFVVPSDGKVTFKIMNYTSSITYKIKNADLSVEKYNCNTGINGGDENSPYTGTTENVLSAGTYYLVLSGPSSGRYKLYSKYTSFGVNDFGAKSFDSPYNYKLGSSITGAITKDDRVDWYRFKMTSGGKINIVFKNYTNAYATYTISNYDNSVKLFDKSVSGMSDGAPGLLKETVELKKGTYYIKIETGDSNYSDKNGVGSYKTYAKLQKLKKKLKYKLTAKRNTKKIKIKTTPGAKVTVKFSGKTYKNKIANKKGIVTIKTKVKLKRGKKINITITKKGFSKIKKSVRVK